MNAVCDPELDSGPEKVSFLQDGGRKWVKSEQDLEIS